MYVMVDGDWLECRGVVVDLWSFSVGGSLVRGWVSGVCNGNWCSCQCVGVKVCCVEYVRDYKWVKNGR